MNLAQIIVDLPTLQTDRAFSYAVPEELAELVQVGMRVHVPFGKGNRLIQGFVLGFEDSSKYDELEVTKFKPIAEVLDAEPVLNSEQLWLADELRHSVFSYKISILKAMLPNLLNSSYDKSILGEDGAEALWSKMTDDEKREAMAAVKSGNSIVTYLAKSKENRKSERYIQGIPQALADFNFGNRSKKRLEFRDFLLAEPDAHRVKNLDFSREIVQFFIENELVAANDVELSRTEEQFAYVVADTAKTLNTEQKKAYEAILQAGKPVLLEGITGSGKTEVYLQVISHFLNQGKTAIMLVPEISLTPLMTNRFIARFGRQVAIMHSGLSDGEKYDEWRKIRSGEAKVVVGARSAIFAPLENIGVIIIDEEHEQSYKQDSSPRYHARDAAKLRADYHGAKLVLGSATPSLESRARAERHVYELLTLTKRANPEALLPSVQILDMRSNLNDASADFSEAMLAKIREKLAKNEQVILMLNKRGYSSFLMCRDCGNVIKCPNCDVSLTLHKENGSWHLNCHYCGHSEVPPHQCPNCGEERLRTYGTGTEQAEEELMKLVPEAKILRMDVDTTRTKGAHEKLLAKFGAGEANVLLGTQMIAKGLDFPNVTLVGVLNADVGLNLPDFRASERTFELLMQVAGRAGRADKAGEVLIQTFNPDHYAITLAAAQDYESFYAKEMAFRKNLAYPPYVFTTQISVSHKDEEVAVKKAYEILTMVKAKLTGKFQILGPTPRAVSRTHNLFHYQLLIKYREEPQLESALNDVLELAQEKENKNLRIVIDSEPLSFV
ncbi:MAG: primosomal protein N' [Streptococcaceae bacterium]|jgi:primosomal protein N' (replication factor Y)|nr:primosomal protein N' [Streptococcaceae bacterium]